MYKVFIDEKVFYASINAQKCIFKEEVMLLPSSKANQVFDIVKNTDKLVCINFFSKKEANIFFDTYFTTISAGGGLVTNNRNEILFIYRNGFWDLPKGKIEKGEKKKAASIREVEEECGISNPTIDFGLTTTYHVYTWKEKHIVKQSFWYKMSYKGNETLVPQKEEGIEKAVWLSKEEIVKIVPNMYGAIKDVVMAYFDTL